jgi:DNA-binding beta-propeller fold protein YncE
MNNTFDSARGRRRRLAPVVRIAATAALLLTGARCSLFSKAPSVPVISGPTAGTVGAEVTFKATAIDPEGDSVAFQFNWGDNSSLGWSGFVASGETASVSHAFADSGSYTVKAKAKDKNGKGTGLSDGVAISILGAVTESYPDSLYGQIAIPGNPAGAAITPDGQDLYVSSYEHDSIVCIRLADRTVTRYIDIGGSSRGLVISQDGSHLYVASGVGTVVSLSLPAATIDTSVYIGHNPQGIALSPDGLHILACAVSERKFAILNANDYSIASMVDLMAVDVVPSADGRLAYVSLPLPDSGGIAIVDVDSGRVVSELTDPACPTFLATTADGGRLFATSLYDSGAVVLETQDRTVIARINLHDAYAGDVVLSPDGALAMVTTDRGIQYLDTRTYSVVDSLACAYRGKLAVGPGFDTLYAAMGERVYVIGRRH